MKPCKRLGCVAMVTFRDTLHAVPGLNFAMAMLTCHCCPGGKRGLYTMGRRDDAQSSIVSFQWWWCWWFWG